jgi:hypothetical protein
MFLSCRDWLLFVRAMAAGTVATVPASQVIGGSENHRPAFEIVIFTFPQLRQRLLVRDGGRCCLRGIELGNRFDQTLRAKAIRLFVSDQRDMRQSLAPTSLAALRGSACEDGLAARAKLFCWRIHDRWDLISMRSKCRRAPQFPGCETRSRNT